MPSVLHAFEDLDRLREIAVVLARHGFGEVLQRVGLDVLTLGAEAAVEQRADSLAQRLRYVLQDLGPSFVKLGQLASTRADLFPPELITELKVLQDDVKPVPWEEALRELEGCLGVEHTELFSWVDPTPLASASIAQVHRARLRATEAEPEAEVALKIQRPKIRETVARDVDLLYWLARALERAIPETRRYSPVEVVGEFERSLKSELDFHQEADNAERFAQNFQGHPQVRFPRVFRRASGRTVLALEFLDGPRLNDALTSGVDGRLIAKRSVGVVIKMIFEDGFFHADPHPGNILVLGPPDDPVLGLLDLGLVGHLSPPLRDRCLDLMVAAAREDFDAVADALYALGRPTRKVDMALFRGDVAALGRKYLGRRLQEIELSTLVRDLAWGATRHGIEMPADFLLVGRSLMTMEGTGRQLYPDLDLLAETRPYFIALVARRYAPDKLTADLVRSALRVTGLANQMPEQVAEILEDLRKGHLHLKATDPELPESLDRLGRRVFTALTVGPLVLSGAVLVAFGRWWWLGLPFFVLALAGAAWHVLRDWWRALGLRR